MAAEKATTPTWEGTCEIHGRITEENGWVRGRSNHAGLKSQLGRRKSGIGQWVSQSDDQQKYRGARREPKTKLEIHKICKFPQSSKLFQYPISNLCPSLPSSLTPNISPMDSPAVVGEQKNL
jgi:hypothetical protein